MKTYELSIHYKQRLLPMTAEIVYESAQIQRIKVSIKDHSITLQNNFPLVKYTKKGVVWKLIEGKPSDPDILYPIMQDLEKKIKKDAEDQQKTIWD